MTFQVALIGNEGIVLGSDRIHIFVGLQKLPHLQPRQRSTECKILVSDDERVLCCFAGGPGSVSIAREIRKSCNPVGLSESAWRDRIEGATKQIEGTGENFLDEVIVMRLDNQTGVMVVKQGHNPIQFNPINDHYFAGDYSDARFLASHLMGPNLTLSEMQNLALTTLAYAHKNNPTGVGGGFDIFSVTPQTTIQSAFFTEDDAARAESNFRDRARNIFKTDSRPVSIETAP